MKTIFNRIDTIRQRIIAVILLLVGAFTATAVDFEVNGIAYNILSDTDKTVKVAARENAERYSGEITLSETVVHNNSTYTVAAIGDFAFSYSSELTDISIPPTVTTIGCCAFRDCSGLVNIIIPPSISIIGDNAFLNCNNLGNIYCEIKSPLEFNPAFSDDAYANANLFVPSGTLDTYMSSEPWCNFNHIGEIDYDNYFEADGIAYNILSRTEHTVEVTRKLGKGFCDWINDSPHSIIIPETVSYNNDTYNVVAIGDYAFKYGWIHEIKIPNSITRIGVESFRWCRPLTSITIPNSVTEIGERAFLDCASLKSLSIGNSVTHIKKEAFVQCTNLKSVTIPASVSNIVGNPWLNCNNLKSFNVENDNKHYTSVDGIIYNKDLTKVIACPSGIESTSITIPATIKEIGDYAFYTCKNISIILNTENIETIGEYGIAWCETLKTFAMNDKVINIPEGAFRGCYNLEQLPLGNNVTSIGDYAFEFCQNLQEVKLPDSVVSIGNKSFRSCYNITSFTGGKNLTSIGDNALETCYMTELTIPSSVTHIGNNAFSNCYDLKKIYCKIITPFECTPNFYNYINEDNDYSVYTHATLYVPEQSVDLYKTTQPWCNFKNIVGMDFSGVDSIAVDIDDNGPVSIYNLNGVFVGDTTDKLAPGIYIKRQGDNAEKIIIR